jgi:hypothetical protein
MGLSPRYTPEVAVAAARVRVQSNTLLGQKSSPELMRLAEGDTGVLRIPPPLGGPFQEPAAGRHAEVDQDGR